MPAFASIKAASAEKPLKKTPEEKEKVKQRLLLLSTRGIGQQYRHLLNDLSLLLPHSKKEAKWETKGSLQGLNELAELCGTNNALFFETRRGGELFWWMGKTPNGPCIKFYVQNVHSAQELKLTGNCLKGSRPLLSFDASFDASPSWKLTKEILI